MDVLITKYLEYDYPVGRCTVYTGWFILIYRRNYLANEGLTEKSERGESCIIWWGKPDGDLKNDLKVKLSDLERKFLENRR